jgi:putative membrane protein
MRSTFTTGCAAATAILLLCTAEPHAQTKTPGHIDMPSPARITTSEYIQQAAMNDLFEIESSKLAVEKADNKDVKSFAERMVKDHGASIKVLAEAASKGQAGVRAPSELDSDHKAKIALLRNASGAEFDKLYVDMQTGAHEHALKLHSGYAKSGDNGQLKAAADTLKGHVEDHLAKISDLRKTIDKKS